MAASLAGVLIGTDVVAMPVAASSKGVDAGKLFAMSFSAQIGSAVSAESNGVSDKSEAVQQLSANGVAEKVNAEGDVGKALVVPMPLGTGGQTVVVQKVADGVVLSDAKAVVTTGAMQKAGAPMAAPPSRNVEVQGAAVDVVTDVDVVSDGSNNSFDDLQTGVPTLSQEAVSAVKSGQIAEAATDEGTPTQGGLTQQSALGGTATSVKVAADGTCQMQGLQGEQKVSFVKTIVPRSSVGDAAAVKKSAKKQDDGKDAVSLKAIDVASGSAGITAANHLVSSSVSGQVPVTSTSCTAVTANVSDCKSQIVTQAAVKSISGYSVNQKNASAIIVDSDKGPAKQIVAAGKAAVAGAAPKPTTGSEQAVLQKSDAAAKASDPVNSAMSVIVAKPQSGETVSSTHLPASATASVVSAAACNSVIHAAGVGPQKSLGADISASVVVGHADHGEASGGQVQTMDGGHRTLVATPTVLEVGIPNGTQGWLKVRAELAGGGVNASVSAASSAGQEMLHRELPALTSYLQQERVAVNSVVVHAPAGGSLRDLSGGFGNGAGGRMQGQDQRRSGQAVVTAGQVFFEGAHVSESDEVLVSAQNLRGGGWLSVRA